MPTDDALCITVEPGRIVLSRPSGRLLPEDIWRAEALKAVIDKGRTQPNGADND